LSRLVKQDQPCRVVRAEEVGTVGAIVLNNDRLGELSELQPEHFFREAHQTLFSSMRVLVADGTGVDLLTFKTHLAGAGLLEKVGGASYIAKLTDVVPRNPHVGEYALVIKALRILTEGGAAVAVLHHITKAAGRENRSTTLDDLRGSSALRDA
jgi:replicative DNA helicase